jgi:hypothetical protein
MCFGVEENPLLVVVVAAVVKRNESSLMALRFMARFALLTMQRAMLRYFSTTREK